ncbi:MAG: DUF6252 family protein [Bacteroidia bacterium]
MKLKIAFSLLVLTALISTSCTPDIVDPTGGSLTATIDGESFSVNGILITATYGDVSEAIQTLSIGGAEPPFNGTTRGLALVVLSSDSTGINEGETYTATTLAKTAAGEYFLSNNSTDIRAYSNNTDVATITITSLDYDKKVVSGTFSFDGVDDDDPGVVYRVRNGEFKDVVFK